MVSSSSYKQDTRNTVLCCEGLSAHWTTNR